MPVVCMSWCACRSSIFCRGAEAGSHGPACALDTVFDVPVALVVQFVYFAVVAQRRLPKVFVTIELHFTATFQRRLSRRVPGHPVWVSRGGHRTRISCARPPLTLLWYRFWIFPCRSWWNSWRTSCASFDTLLPVPEQVIEVPKLLPEDVPTRTMVRDTQLVEQLVEVPTIVSYSSLQRTMEQNVDFPVPDRGVQGFSSQTEFNSVACFSGTFF